MNADLKLRLTPFTEMDMTQTMWWEQMVAGLSDSLRSWYPIHVHMIEIDPPEHPDDDTGYIEFDDSLPHEEKAFHVYLDKRMPLGMCIDYLIHELAHAGSWFVNEPEPHGPHFGTEWAKLYRKYLFLYDQLWDVL